MSEPIKIIEANECSLCGGVLEMKTEPVSVRIGERHVEVSFTHRKCDSCGEVFHRPDESRALRQAAAAEIRRQDGLLIQSEVADVRHLLGLTQDEFDNFINAGKKTSARWETGAVAQSGAADSLIRILRDVPEAVAYLSKITGISVARTASAPRPLSPEAKVISIEPYLRVGIRSLDKSQQTSMQRMEAVL